MLFNPDTKKPAHEVISSRKNNKVTHAIVFYSDIEVSRKDTQKN